MASSRVRRAPSSRICPTVLTGGSTRLPQHTWSQWGGRIAGSGAGGAGAGPPQAATAIRRSSRARRRAALRGGGEGTGSTTHIEGGPAGVELSLPDQ